MNPGASVPLPTTAKPPTAVAVLGEALVDVYPDGSQVPGGAPYNVARWLAAFGVPVVFVSRLGQADAAAALLRADMARVGLDDRAVQADPLRATGCVQVLPAPEGHRFVIEAESAWDHIDAEAAASAMRGVHAVSTVRAQAPQALCFGSLALRHAVSAQAITRCVADSGAALRLLDLNLRGLPGQQALAEQALHLATWVKVNDEELQQLQQWFALSLAGMSQRFGVQRWLVTCGAQGWYSADAQGQVDARGVAEALPQLADTVGAGDAFTAAVLAGQAHGWPLLRCLQAANRLAAAVCGWRGALPADSTTVHHWRDRLGFGPAAAAVHP